VRNNKKPIIKNIYWDKIKVDTYLNKIYYIRQKLQYKSDVKGEKYEKTMLHPMWKAFE